MRGQVNIRQDDGARVRVAGAQVVEKILAQVGSGVHVEDEEVWAVVQDEELRLFEITRHIDVGGRGRFAQGYQNSGRELLLRFEDQDAPAFSNGILRLGGSVHNSIERG
jgi:hypothetical protein